MARGRGRRYWHGEGITPTGPYDKAYQKGPIFNRLIKHLKDTNVGPSSTAHYNIYNDNAWLWKIDPNKFTNYYQAAYEKMARGGKKTPRFEEDESNYDDNYEEGTVEDSIDLETHGQEPMSIIKSNGRYGGGSGDGSGGGSGGGNVEELTKTLGGMSLVQYKLQLSMTADEHKKINGWSCWESDTGRLSDDGTKTLRELNMLKRIAHPQDFESYKLQLIATGSTLTGCKLEEESPAISHADDTDKDELMESVEAWVKGANTGNVLLTSNKLTANTVGREAGLTDLLEKEKVKPTNDSDEGIKIKKNKIQYETPHDPTIGMPMQASCNDWQGDTYAAPPSGVNRYRIKLTHKPILNYDMSHKGDVDGSGNPNYYETVRHYIFATIPVGVRTDTGKSPKKSSPKEDQTSDITRQKKRIAELKKRIGGN